MTLVTRDERTKSLAKMTSKKARAAWDAMVEGDSEKEGDAAGVAAPASPISFGTTDDAVAPPETQVGAAVGSPRVRSGTAVRSRAMPQPLEMFPLFRRASSTSSSSSGGLGNANELAMRRPVNVSKRKNMAKAGGKRAEKKPRQMYQACLDIGKNIGHQTCSTCGMIYTPGEPNDEKMHTKYHDEVTNGVKLTAAPPEKLVLRNVGLSEWIVCCRPGEKQFRTKASAVLKLMDSELGYISTTLEHSKENVYLYIKDHRIVGCITAIAISTAYKVVPDRGESAEEIAATAVKEEPRRAAAAAAPSNANPPATENNVAHSPKEKKNKKLRGVSTSLIERIREKERQRKALLELEAAMTEAQAAKKREKDRETTSAARLSEPQPPLTPDPAGPIAPASAPSTASRLTGAFGAAANPKSKRLPTSSASRGGNSVCRSTVPERAQCGISRLWVHRNHRRKNIASKILDTIRTHFIYGYEFSPSELAFSQPTPAGQMFASNYTGRGDFLVYIGAD